MHDYATCELEADPARFVIFDDVDLDEDIGIPLRARSCRDDGLNDLAQALSHAGTPSARHALVQAALRAAGFDSLCHMRVMRVGDTLGQLSYFNSHTRPGWAQQYMRERLFEVDARLAFSCRHEWPMLWDLSTIATAPGDNLAALSAAAARQRVQRLTNAARQAGMLSGVTFGLATPDALATCIVHCASSQPSRTRLPDTAIGQAYAIAAGLHEFLQSRAPHFDGSVRRSPLNSQQRKILELVTLGLNDREIAKRLDVSHHSVEHTVRQLKQIHHAANRVQLAYIAGRVLGGASSSSSIIS